VIFYRDAAEQVNSLEAKLATAPDTQQLEQQVADLQAERTALQTQITDLNQQVAKTESDHSELEKRFSTTQNRLESAGTEIADLHSKAQALLEQVAQAEQAARTAQAAQVAQAEKTEPVSQPQPVKISEASSVSEVLQVLQENALVHADVFKITALKLDASLEGFKFNEAILLPGHKELLNRLIPLLKPLEVQLKLIGHTDSTGNYSAVNLFLSHLRALVASKNITEKLDFPRERVYVTGRAHLKPTAENTSIPMRMKNRRVDLHLEIHNGHALEKLP
jgi:flagellar motor protein MotB